MTTRRLVLLGGGHAHVHLLARFARAPLAGVELVMVSAFAHQHYSGMVPGFLSGTYEERDLVFDLGAMAARAGARFVATAAERIDAGARTIETEDQRIAYDLLSIDIGSEPAALATPGVREHAASVRPMSRAVALRERAMALFSAEGKREVPVVVVGAGASGLEVALALDRLGRKRGARARVTLVEAESRVLPGFSARVRTLAERVLAGQGVTLRCGARVSSVEPDRLRLDDGTILPAELTVWLAGAAPPSLFSRSDLPKSPRGYLLVDPTLRAVDGSPLFGAGDCIDLAGSPGLAKAGVYAVREAPVLDHNLRAAFGGGTPRRYRPQRTYLALMSCADRTALWRWHTLAGRSRTAWWLKDRIDRAFMRRYQRG